MRWLTSRRYASVAGFGFCDDATGVANFCKGRSHCWPVYVPSPRLTDTFAESANPVLWIAAEQDVADVEPGLDPRAFGHVSSG